MLIKDLQSGTVRKYGSDCHDSLAISQDGRTLSYYNLQCGDGSKYGDFRFVMEDGEVPQDSQTPDAMNCECYFNIGVFDRNLSDHDKKISDEVISEMLKQVEFEEKWLSDAWKENGYNYSSGDVDIAFSGIKRKLIQMKGEQNE